MPKLLVGEPQNDIKAANACKIVCEALVQREEPLISDHVHHKRPQRLLLACMQSPMSGPTASLCALCELWPLHLSSQELSLLQRK